MLIFKLKLQRFAEGSDGASSGAEGESGETGEIEVPAAVPERAKARYKEVFGKQKPVNNKPVEKTEPEAKEEEKPVTKLSYEELIKSDDYKDAHKAYMEKTINERFKNQKQVDSDNKKMRSILETVANKYGTDINDEHFLENLGKAIDEDDSYYEKYAQDHDLTPTEARQIVTLQRRLAESDRLRAEQEQQARINAQLQALNVSAERTRQIYPGFNLELEMQNPDFMRMCAATNGDTTAAYRTIHWQELTTNMVTKATEDAKNMTAQSIKSKQNRPSEAGLSSQASVSIQDDFSSMNLEQIRAYAAEQERKKAGR